MKKLLTALITLIAFTVTNAQNCNQYFPLVEGIAFEQTNYNSKDKIQSVSNHKIISVSEINNGIEAKLKANIKDGKSKDLSSMDYVIKCQNGNLMVDLKSIIPTGQLSQYEGMEMDISEGYANFPPNAKVGDKLDDVTITIKISSSGIAMMTMDIIISDRFITKSEKITTPAGSYECLVLTQNSTVKMGGMMPMTRKSSSKEWIAKNIGLVKSEQYNKNNKLESYTLLTKFSN